MRKKLIAGLMALALAVQPVCALPVAAEEVTEEVTEEEAEETAVSSASEDMEEEEEILPEEKEEVIEESSEEQEETTEEASEEEQLVIQSQDEGQDDVLVPSEAAVREVDPVLSTEDSLDTASTSGDVPTGIYYWLQSDPRWCAYPFHDGTIQSNACGMTCAAMVISNYLNKEVSPLQIASELGGANIPRKYDTCDGSYNLDENGNSDPYSAIPRIVERYCGKKLNETFGGRQYTTSTAAAKQAIQAGKMVVVLSEYSGGTNFFPGGYGGSGHYVLAWGTGKTGTGAYVYDPNYYSNTMKSFTNGNDGLDIDWLLSHMDKAFIFDIVYPGLKLSSKYASYTGAPIEIGAASTSGDVGTVSYTYYTDPSCTTKTGSENGAAKEGGAPSEVGRYYVQAKSGSAVSNTAILRIGDPSVSISNTSADGFDVTVTNADYDEMKSCQIAVWTRPKQDDLKWYSAERQSDGTYQLHVSTSSHKSEGGHYAVHAYMNSSYGMSFLNGTDVTVPAAMQTTVTEDSIDVTVKGYNGSNGINSMVLAVWTDEDGQDDLKWYFMKQKTDGSYTVSVPVSDHNNESGTYLLHAYMFDGNGKQKFVVASTAEYQAPVYDGLVSVINTTSEGFQVVISGVKCSLGLKEIVVPVWTSNKGQDDLVWYKATQYSETTYKVYVPTTNHNCESGDYNIHVYYKTGSGSMKCVSTTKQTVPAGKTSVKTEYTGDQLVITVSGLASADGVKEVYLPVWTNENGQDDIHWYKATKQKDGTWKATVNMAEHGSLCGHYLIHCYVTDLSGKQSFTGSDSVYVPESKGTMSIEAGADKDTVKVTVSGLALSSKVRKISIAVWTPVKGQDELKWYTAAKQSDGTYQCSFSRSADHNGEAGTYVFHCYVTASGQPMTFMNAASVSI